MSRFGHGDGVVARSAGLLHGVFVGCDPVDVIFGRIQLAHMAVAQMQHPDKAKSVSEVQRGHLARGSEVQGLFGDWGMEWADCRSETTMVAAGLAAFDEVALHGPARMNC